MKATGAEIKEFYVNNWPKGYYHEDCYLLEDDNGNWILPLDKEYDLADMGYLVPETQGDCIPFEQAFLVWKGLNTKVYAVTVPDAVSAEVFEFLKSKGCIVA